MLRDIVYQTVREEVWAAATAMDWLKHVATVIAKANLPIIWKSPAGFPVVQEYKKLRGKRVDTHIGGLRIRQRILIEDEDIDMRSQASAIAPNFVHSCDAAHLMLTVNKCVSEGIENFHMIHDSYGTHAPNTSKLARILREVFVEMYTPDRLMQFKDELSNFLPTVVTQEIEDPPKRGDFDLSKVMTSRYFFI